VLAALLFTTLVSTALARASTTQPNPHRPNILWIMCDQLRYDCLGFNGNTIIKTPNLDQLASQSANFTRFYVQSPVCVPSRASYFTGRYPHSHHNRVNYTPLSQTEILLPARLQHEGYRTALIGKTHLYYHYPPTADEARRTGFDLVDLHDAAGFTDPYSDYVKWRKANDPNWQLPYRRYAKDVGRLRKTLPPDANPDRAAIDEKYSETAWTGLRTRDRIAEMAGKSQPFFIFCSFWKPHGPYEVSAPYDSMYSNVNIPLPEPETLQTIGQLPLPAQKLILRGKKPEYLTSREQLEWDYRSYYGTISQIDTEIGLILQSLKAAGAGDNTIIIFSTDHGDQMLEHGLFGKNVFFESSVHVPFFINYPGHVRPGRVDALAESVDALPTLFEFIGLDEPVECQGQSLAPLIDGSGRPGPKREAVFSENVIPEVITGGNLLFEFEKGKGVAGIRHPDAKMVRTAGWKYNYYPDGYAELYDMEADPHERHNLAADPAQKERIEHMKDLLLQWMITADEADQIAPRWLMH
jgi:arylsulfatase A-like enzyme